MNEPNPPTIRDLCAVPLLITGIVIGAIIMAFCLTN